MKKTLISALAISAFLTFFCWGFPALRGTEVNWLHAAGGFVAFAAVAFLVSWLSSGALNQLLEKEERPSSNDKKGNR